jgi:hypothetical protein
MLSVAGCPMRDNKTLCADEVRVATIAKDPVAVSARLGVDASL